jgi:hypothetical protein
VGARDSRGDVRAVLSRVLRLGGRHRVRQTHKGSYLSADGAFHAADRANGTSRGCVGKLPLGQAYQHSEKIRFSEKSFDAAPSHCYLLTPFGLVLQFLTRVVRPRAAAPAHGFLLASRRGSSCVRLHRGRSPCLDRACPSPTAAAVVSPARPRSRLWSQGASSPTRSTCSPSAWAYPSSAIYSSVQ